MNFWDEYFDDFGIVCGCTMLAIMIPTLILGGLTILKLILNLL